MPAQRVHEFTRDAETQPGSSEFARPGLIDLPEVFPDRSQIFRPDSNAGVGNVEAKIGLVLRDRDGDAAVVGELHRVRQQVEQNLFHLGAIGVQHLIAVRHLDMETELLLLHEHYNVNHL